MKTAMSSDPNTIEKLGLAGISHERKETCKCLRACTNCKGRVEENTSSRLTPSQIKMQIPHVKWSNTNCIKFGSISFVLFGFVFSVVDLSFKMGEVSLKWG